MAKYVIENFRKEVISPTANRDYFDSLDSARAFGVGYIAHSHKPELVRVWVVLKREKKLKGIIYLDKTLGFCWLDGMAEYAKHVSWYGAVSSFTNKIDLMLAKEINEKIVYLW